MRDNRRQRFDFAVPAGELYSVELPVSGSRKAILEAKADRERRKAARREAREDNDYWN